MNAVNSLASVYLVEAVRTPIGRYNGALASVRPDDRAAHTIRAVLGRPPELDRSSNSDPLDAP